MKTIFWHPGKIACISCLLCLNLVLILRGPANAQTGVLISDDPSGIPNPKAALEVRSTNQGILIPRISIIALPQLMFTQGLLVYVYDGSEPGFWYNDGLGWMKILRSGDAKWSGSPDISYTGGKVGIGTSGPSSSLDVEFWNSLSDGIDINNSGTGDPVLNFQLGGTTKYTLGIDNSDADKFKIGGSALATSPKMTITESGDMGIGTESPSARIDVESSDAAATNIDINNTGSTGDPQIRYQVGGVTKFAVGVDNSDGGKFKIGSTNVSTSTKMTVTAAGEVGVGTETPSANFQVNGSVKMFGPWVTGSISGQDYQAATDGFVVAGLIITSGETIAANATLTGYTSSASHPVTIRGLACVRREPNITFNLQESFTMPVRKGDYWRVEFGSQGTGTYGYSIDWIPFGTNNP